MTIAGEAPRRPTLTAPIFLGGCPRSGLTLLRVVLDSHPCLTCGPDSGVLGLVRAAQDFESKLGELHRGYFELPTDRVRANFSTAISEILAARAEAARKPRVAEKSPMNILMFRTLADLFPDAKFVHVVRDGRDVAASLTARNWINPRTGRLFEYCANAGAAAAYWSGLVSIGRAAEEGLGPGKVFRIRYEDIALAPEATLRGLFDFLDLPWSAEVLNHDRRNHDLAGLELESAAALAQPINASSVGRFRIGLSPGDVARVEATAGTELAALGYR